MGQVANMARAERFIQEFEDDIVVRSQFKVGQTLKVVKIRLAPRDGGGGEVVEAVVLADQEGFQLSVESDGPFFWPDDGQEDLVERLSFLEEERVVEGLKRAKL